MTEVFGKEKYKQLLKKGIYPFAKELQWIRTHRNIDFKNEFDPHKGVNYDNKKIVIGGRLRNRRPMKNYLFWDLQDETGFLQICFNKINLPNEKLEILLKNTDLGDCFLIKGYPVLTENGTLSLEGVDFQFVTKTFKPYPEKKFFKKAEKSKYKNFYVDLTVNYYKKLIFQKRAILLNSLRNFFAKNGYLEVETPILHPVAGGAAAKPFVTFFESLSKKFYLRIAPELYLKKLIVAGFERIFEIGKLFRNEGISYKHNPEFTSIEVYTAYEDIEFLIDLTKKCFQEVVLKVNNSLLLKYQNIEINFAQWNKISYFEAINKELNINFLKIKNFEKAKLLAKKYQIKLETFHFSIDHIANLFFEKYVENKLIQPTIIYDFPSILSPLAKTKEENKRLAKRFEVYINGEELANAYFELNDPFEQEKKFLIQQEEKKLGNDEIMEVDYDYLEALKHGMPATSGLGIGIDRLLMLLTNCSNIKEVMFFPMMPSALKNFKKNNNQEKN